LTQSKYDELFKLADRAIGAAVNFAKYLESAGPDWKKNYRKRQRGQHDGKPLPDGKIVHQATADPADLGKPTEPVEPAEPVEPKNPRTRRTQEP
jgi:hypothetical protein